MMCWVGCSLTQLDTTNLTGLLQHLPMEFHVDNYHRTTNGSKSKTQMKLISTKLGNPEVCVNIPVNITGTLAEELLRPSRTVYFGSRRIEEACSGGTALPEVCVCSDLS